MLNIVQNNLITFHSDGFKQGFFYEENSFYPLIGKNVTEISVDLSWRSKLQFDATKVGGEELILWQLDLGLREALMPLEDEGQFAAQMRALQEFVQQLYEPLRGRSFGISLYKGALDFDPHAPLLDYLKLLTAYLPEGVPLFLMLDGTELSEPLFLARTNKEHYFPFHLILKHALVSHWPYSFDCIGWGSSTVSGAAYSTEAKIPSVRLPNAFLLPHSSCGLAVWEQLLTHRELIGTLRARLIPEALLTEMWEGVEELYLLEASVTTQGKRKLAGFAAAGGTLHYL